MIPYGKSLITEEDIQAVTQVLRGDWLTTGPKVDEFEAALACLCRQDYAVAVSSGTAALHCAYAGAGLGPGTTLLTTPLTFAATANAALALGATVRFADVDAQTGLMTADSVRTALRDVHVLAPVDFAGHPVDYDRLRPLAHDAGATLIADASHSLGATLHERPVGSLADATVFSFHPVKVITTAEGGAVLTNAPTLARRAKDFRNHGMVRDPERQEQVEGPWSYEIQSLGLNYRLTDLQCALGITQLRKLASFVSRRQQIADRYREAWRSLDALQLPQVMVGASPAWHLFVVRVRQAQHRLRFFERLRALGLGVQVHYIPVHWHPLYQALGFRRGEFPVAEDFYQRAVSLPIFPGMTDAMVEQVIEIVTQVTAEILD